MEQCLINLNKMTIRIIFIVIAGLFILFFTSFYLFRDKLLFFVYGYPQELISSVTANAFTAHKSVYTGKIVFLISSIFLGVLTSIGGYYFYYLNGEKLNVIRITFYVSIFLTAILLISLAMFWILPKRYF